ncbi:hypothetical protein DUI87_31500 [Hirundo rustica rustica]|uniref:Uncharacterized protein n=1 Tax=Hirundo rustica rustica TaxID=333673 RepID=A0A3M0IU76_HIRRU|nr:hypothetical protein DUI87_31500 [Hirundo rustica rustica]
MFFTGMAPELLHEMMEKFPIFVLLAAGLLDLSGVPREVPAALAQALVQQFRTSLDAGAKNLSAGRGEPPTLLPSSPHLSFVLRSSDGMICLQPVQDSPLPSEFPNSSVGGLLSVQQILAAPNSSALDLANLHLSPSSLVLPASHRLEEVSHLLENVSQPLNEVSHPLENISYPLEKVSQPLEKVPHPLENISHSLENISHPLENVSHPLENISHPLENVSHPPENVSHPLENISHPLQNGSHPLHEVSHPLENISYPLDEVSHTLENVPHPLEVSHPLENVSHPLEEMFHPLDKVSHPLEEASHPLEKVSHLLENVSHPLQNVFQPLEVSHSLENISQPLEDVSHSLENIFYPLEEVSQPLEVSHPLENVSHPLEEVSHPLENASHPLEEESHPLDEVSHPLGNVSHPLEEDALELGPGHSSPVPANGLVNQGTNELLPARDPTRVPPESPRQPPGSPGQPWPDAAGTASAQGLLLSTEEAEEEGRTSEATDGAAEGSGTAVTPQPGAPRSDWHQRRELRSEVTALDGQVPAAARVLWVLPLQPAWLLSHSIPFHPIPFQPIPFPPFFPSLAVVSDACGSGNHSVRLSLSPAGDTAPGTAGSEPSHDTFVALLALQSNGSRALLHIHSCCVSPSASPGAAGAQCCLFRRLPWECRHIQPLKGGSSRAASFSIQLFQMLNQSVAYLHCQLRVCLPGQPGCEQDCLESVEPLPQPSDRTSHGNPHSLVSLGPVWRMNNRFLYKPVEGAGPAVLLPVLLGSLTGCAVLGSAFMGLWLRHRHRAKPSRHLLPGEFHGL